MIQAALDELQTGEKHKKLKLCLLIYTIRQCLAIGQTQYRYNVNDLPLYQ